MQEVTGAGWWGWLCLEILDWAAGLGIMKPAVRWGVERWGSQGQGMASIRGLRGGCGPGGVPGA